MSARQSRIDAKEMLPGKVFNKFKILLAEKEIKDSHKRESNRISYIEIRDDIEARTGIKIASSTLSKWANNEIERFDVVTLVALCDYLDCSIGDLLIYEPFLNDETLSN